MMTSVGAVHLLLQLNTPWFWRRRKEKFQPKILRIFRQKHLDFHPQIPILQSKPKKMHKKHKIGRTKQALIFEISPNELQKPQKRWVLLQTIFSTSLPPQSGLKTKNKHQTKKKPSKKWLP